MNGNVKTYGAMIITIIVLAVGIIYGYSRMEYQVGEMQPEVKKNSEHRIQFEEKVSAMEKNIVLILKAVQK